MSSARILPITPVVLWLTILQRGDFCHVVVLGDRLQVLVELLRTRGPASTQAWRRDSAKRRCGGAYLDSVAKRFICLLLYYFLFLPQCQKKRWTLGGSTGAESTATDKSASIALTLLSSSSFRLRSAFVKWSYVGSH